jgi:hypothetical protein
MINDLFHYSKKILSDSEINEIRNYILENETNIKSLGVDTYPGTSKNSLTGLFAFFNYLHVETIGKNILLPKIKEMLREINVEPPIIIQCWANVFRNGEGISAHRHGNMKQKFYSGNLFISGNTKPGTTYYAGPDSNPRPIDVENEPGVLNIFPCDSIHLVKENSTEEVRISMALDVVPYDDIKHYTKLDMLYQQQPRRYIKLDNLD